MYLQPTHMLVAYPVLTKRTADAQKLPLRDVCCPLASFTFVIVVSKLSWESAGDVLPL